MPTLPPEEVAGALRRMSSFQFPWAGEGPVRHVLRGLFCRDGAAWQRADQTAADLVETARQINGTEEPHGWDELATGFCIVCAGPLPRRQKFYCSPTCKMERARLRWADKEM